MYIRECNICIKSGHTHRPGFVIHSFYEWLVTFISAFLLLDINSLFQNSIFPFYYFIRIVPHRRLIAARLWHHFGSAGLQIR